MARGWPSTLAALYRRLTLKPATARRPDVAPGGTPPEDATRFYAVGDIHGRLDLLQRLEALIRADVARHPVQQSTLIFLGDYIDRGPDSSRVIAHFLDRPAICTTEVFLRGNHEQVLLDFLKSPDVLEEWARFGGLETLVSYGLRPRLPLGSDEPARLRDELAAALPDTHRAFLERTRYCHETPTHFFAHAGVNPDRPLSDQRPADLMWIREQFLLSARRLPKTVVHGHTPTEQVDVLPDRINVDTGAYLTGRLSCAVIGSRGCRVLQTGG